MLLGGLPLLASLAAAQPVPPVALPRAPGPITVDGDLSDPAWAAAAVVDTFYEAAFGDNRKPIVRTVARLMYDDRYFYVGVQCDDPHPERIRAPYVDRDNVLDDQDNFVVFVDAANDRRSAQEFRVNPRGIQTDAIYNDANGNQDFSPDFYYDTAARITAQGWTAEMRIPLSSLRYPAADSQSWGILLWRNLPREFRYSMFSSPIPRNTNCLICLSGTFTGLRGLPSSRHLVAAPYVSGQRVDLAPEPGAPLDRGALDAEAGIDLKWSPTAATALDATVNPDFSQIEADVAQIAVNNRFALFYPEKRPFFLEGFDLFDTAIPAVYTRTITSPAWGGRVTGKAGGAAYTLLTAQDRGGGSVILPGPTGSDLAPQDYRSFVGIGRLRQTLGSSFVGLLYAGREIEGGGHNRVVGPDFQWRPGSVDAVSGQFLWSDSETPSRPDLTPDWDGRRLRGHGLTATWAHTPPNYHWFLRYSDFSDAFRADEGYVPQVGYRRGYAEASLTFYRPRGLFSRLQPFVLGDYQTDREGHLISRRVGSLLSFQGKGNLQGALGLNFDRMLTGSELLNRTQATFNVALTPSRFLAKVGLAGDAGEQIDLVNVRVGRGVDLTATATLRPTSHLGLDIVSSWSWLDVDASGGGRARLFTALVQRLKLVYNFTPRLYVRLIGEYVDERRDPSLYSVPVDRRSASFTGSALFAYRLNWQTAFFAGYGDDRTLSPTNELVRTGRQFFVKLSYAFQR
jgi:hypothetical protein